MVADKAWAIPSDLVGPFKQLRVYPVAHNQPINTILAGASALVTSDAQHGQLAGYVAECDGALTRHDSVSQSARDSGAAAMSSAAWILLSR
jgi:hypothetical protein